MNTDQLKYEANAMARVVASIAVLSTLQAFERRAFIREQIRAQLDANKLEGAARRFCADYLMAQFGYGGGF